MECVECGRHWEAVPRTGRPRRYCSRACQARAYRRRRDEGRLSRAGAGPTDDPGAPGILDAAIALADARGIGNLTLRLVAAHADLSLEQVQREVGSRDRLVAAMVQRIYAATSRGPAPAGPPVSSLHRLAEEEWARYRAHPWLVEVLASTRPPLVPAVLDASRAAYEEFRALGCGPEAALHRYLAFSGYIQGMALLLRAESDETARTGTTYRRWWTQERRRLDAAGARWRHPWLDKLMEQSADAFDADAAFREGLAPILEGLMRPPEVGTTS